ncbi:MAG: hypothetical protein K9J37_18030 [Saprospiraceae bacterium]|nr:hypothetical protein [Saprospiraceae bacterium]
MKQDLKTVILDFSLLAVVVILFFIYGKMKISEKGVSGYLIMVFSSFLTFFSILISTRVNEKLLNYISKIVVLIFIIALIAPLLFNQISYSYAIQFGLLTGLFLGRITKNIILMFNK